MAKISRTEALNLAMESILRRGAPQPTVSARTEARVEVALMGRRSMRRRPRGDESAPDYGNVRLRRRAACEGFEITPSRMRELHCFSISDFDLERVAQ